MLLNCCKCVSFFGILFYVIMGFIILGQSEFLRFEVEDVDSSVGACFVTALIELLIIIAITVYQKRSSSKSVERDNYFDLGSEREIRRDSTFKGIAMGDLKLIRQDQQSSSREEANPSAMQRED